MADQAQLQRDKAADSDLPGQDNTISIKIDDICVHPVNKFETQVWILAHNREPVSRRTMVYSGRCTEHKRVPSAFHQPVSGLFPMKC